MPLHMLLSCKAMERDSPFHNPSTDLQEEGKAAAPSLSIPCADLCFQVCPHKTSLPSEGNNWMYSSSQRPPQYDTHKSKDIYPPGKPVSIVRQADLPLCKIVLNQ